jgi:predicted nucleic acid-binding protein
MSREILLADTSYVSAAQRVAERRADYSWPRLVRSRLRAAKIAVSVISVGEVRAGNLERGTTRPRISASERWLARFPRVDVDEAIAHRWAILDEEGHRRGLVFSDNDLWIAATAQTLGVPIVTCDRAFAQMPELDVEIVYLSSSRAATAGDVP